MAVRRPARRRTNVRALWPAPQTRSGPPAARRGTRSAPRRNSPRTSPDTESVRLRRSRSRSSRRSFVASRLALSPSRPRCGATPSPRFVPGLEARRIAGPEDRRAWLSSRRASVCRVVCTSRRASPPSTRLIPSRYRNRAYPPRSRASRGAARGVPPGACACISHSFAPPNEGVEMCADNAASAASASRARLRAPGGATRRPSRRASRPVRGGRKKRCVIASGHPSWKNNRKTRSVSFRA